LEKRKGEKMDMRKDAKEKGKEKWLKITCRVETKSLPLLVSISNEVLY